MRIVRVCACLVGVGIAVWFAWRPAAPRVADPRAEQVTHEYCIQCGTDRHTTETWRGGRHTGPSEEVCPSTFYVDFLDTSHEHKWVLNCVCTEYADGGESIGCGFDGFPNQLVMQYDMNEEFREFVKTRIAEGAVKSEAIARVATLSDLESDTADIQRARALLEEFPGELR
jgi:hypothetical protein